MSKQLPQDAPRGSRGVAASTAGFVLRCRLIYPGTHAGGLPRRAPRQDQNRQSGLSSSTDHVPDAASYFLVRCCTAPRSASKHRSRAHVTVGQQMSSGRAVGAKRRISDDSSVVSASDAAASSGPRYLRRAPVSTERPRRSRGRSPRLTSTEYPRRTRGVAATRLPSSARLTSTEYPHSVSTRPGPGSAGCTTRRARASRGPGPAREPTAGRTGLDHHLGGDVTFGSRPVREPRPSPRAPRARRPRLRRNQNVTFPPRSEFARRRLARRLA